MNKCLFLLGLVVAVVPAMGQNERYTFTTMAGDSGLGATDGTGSAARFYWPSGIASDAAGNLYVVDPNVNTLRKITPEGVVTTIAGLAGKWGNADGVGSTVRFNNPHDVGVGPDGSVYIADSSNQAIRRMTPDGIVRTLAGGQYGSADGLGNGARFRSPRGLVVSSAGVVFVADSSNHTIRRVDVDGIVTTVAGLAGVSGATNGIGSAARFNDPNGIALDDLGNLYVADTGNAVIRKITPDGAVTTYAGQNMIPGSDDGLAANARFWSPRSVEVAADGTVYVGDSSSLRKITPAGFVTTVRYGISYVNGLTLDRNSGAIFIADASNHVIRKLATDGSMTTFAGRLVELGSGDGIGTTARFNYPKGIIEDGAGTLYIADNSNAIRRLTSAGYVTTVAGSFNYYETTDGIGTGARFSSPSGLSKDRVGNLFVVEYGAVRKIDASGYVTTIAGGGSLVGNTDAVGRAARFNNPTGIAVDAAGNVWVADTQNHTIRKIAPSGQVTTPFGTISIAGYTDGFGNSAQFNSPTALVFDAEENLYVCDMNNHVIRKITPAGVVSTVAGRRDAYGAADGPAAEATFQAPSGIAVDSEMNLFVTDFATNTVRRIAADGFVTTIGGRDGMKGYVDGSGADSLFADPHGVAVDRFGHIYISDSGNDVIRRGSVTGAKPPVFLSHPTAKTVGAGREASFTVSAGGPPAPIYQWERRAAGAATFVALSEGAGFSGVETATLRVTSPTVAMNGDQFRCVANNGLLPTATSNPAMLTVTPPPVFTSLATAAFAVGVDGEFSVAATGATEFKVASGTLPSWATLDATTGRITGQPPEDAEGPYTFVINAMNAAVEPTAQSFTLEIDPGPTVVEVPTARTANAGSTTILHVDVAGRAPITYQWSKGGIALVDSPRVSGATTATLTISKTEAADAAAYSLVATGPSANATIEPFQLTIANPPTITTQPVSQTVAVGERVGFSVVATSSSPVSFQWYVNGTAISGATGSAHSISAASHTSNGYYAVRVSDAVTSVMSEPALLTVQSNGKVAGTATEVGPNITHQNGRIYDQVLLTGAAGTFRADPGEVLRVSCVDLNDDIVQIEFAGAGTLHVRLDNATGLANPARYNQSVQYMRGHPSITIAGADDSTYLTIFTVGSITAINQTLFHSGVTYDGMADIGFVSISSANGKFGGIFSGNASYWNTSGLTGIYAPGVEFVAPVVLGELSAADSAQAVLVLGAATDIRVAGGDLTQMNHQPLQISGVAKLAFTAGANSHGVARPAQRNQARLERDNTNVTTDVVVNPTP